MGELYISAHKHSSSPDNHVEVILPPAGNACGGSLVNKKFEEFLEDLVNDKGFTQYIDTGDETLKTTHQARLNELVNDTLSNRREFLVRKEGKEASFPFVFHTFLS